MSRKERKQPSMLNARTVLIITAFGIWLFVMMYVADSGESIKDAVISYGGNTVLILVVSYIALLLIEIFVDFEDTDR